MPTVRKEDEVTGPASAEQEARAQLRKLQEEQQKRVEEAKERTRARAAEKAAEEKAAKEEEARAQLHEAQEAQQQRIEEAKERARARSAEARAQAAAEPKRYTVKAGDTLGKIAQQMYGDGSRWKEIWEANKDAVPNPDLIQVGQVLKIP